MPKVSVIIPVYNVENYLAECLDSVINQTEKEIEIICVDDCSTDSSLKILQEYAKKEERIIVVKNEVNSGQSVARNKGLSIAKGECVLFVDSDDFIESNLLETTLRYIENVDMVCFNYKLYNPYEIPVGISNSSLIDVGLYSNEAYFIESAKKKSFIVLPVSKLYKREFLIRNNLQFEPGMIYEDNLFFLQCVLKAQSVYSINESLYIYRIRPDSTMTKKVSLKNVNDHFKLLYELTNEYINSDVSENFAEAIENFINMLVRCYARIYKTYIKDNGKICSKIEFVPSKLNKLQRTFTKTFCGFSDVVNFEDDFFIEVSKWENIVIFGAGDVARELLAYFDLIDIAIVGVVVSDIKNSKKCLMGHKVKELGAYQSIRNDCLVIIAANSRFSSEIEEILKEYGFKNYIKLF